MKIRILLSLLALTGIAQAQSAQAQSAPAPTVPAAPASEAAPFFRDVPRDHWAFAAVQRLAAAGIVQGVPPTSAPQRVVGAPATKTAVATSRVAAFKSLETQKRSSAKAVPAGITIEVSNPGQKPVLILQGTAKTQQQKRMAGARAVKSAAGFQVVNRLRLTR